MLLSFLSVQFLAYQSAGYIWFYRLGSGFFAMTLLPFIFPLTEV
jgi:hypothetical protein